MNNPHPNRSHAGEHTTAGPPNRVVTLLRHDLPASFVVFLIAVPLSLGIAAATGAPLIAGLISAVIGGIVVGLLSGAPLQVSGPAAGLVVITAGLISQYGWPATAAITLAAGLLQLALGLTGVGRLALSLSPAVVHGMLAGIGISIAAGQLVVVLGGQAVGSVLANVAELPAELASSHIGSVVAGVVTVAAFLLWPRVPRSSLVPAPLVAVAAGTLASVLLSLDLDRVDLPDDPLGQIVLPAMPDGSIAGVVLAVVTVALVASVESLLSAVAVDKLHNGPRANLDRELIAQGAGNALAGALGGLPITGVVVRSSTNVAAGARTRASTVLHGFWVAVFVLALGSVLELIPLSALAGVLLVVGVRLVSVAHMRTLWKHREFVVYAATGLGVVLFGLLEGVVIGVAIAVLRALLRLTNVSVRVEHDRVSVRGSLIFLGVGRLVRELRRIPLGRDIVLELHVDYLDHASYEAINDWREGYERLGGRVRVDEVHDTWYDRAHQGKPGRRKTLPGPLPRWFAPWSHWQGTGAAVSLPSQRSESNPMLVGMHEFERRSAPLVRPFLAELAVRGQQPKQLFITCADSRVVPNLITTSGPGDLFCLRNIGNLVPTYGSDDRSVGAAVELAVETLGVSTIVVCGHSDCGAMKALVRGSATRGSHLHTWLRNAEPSLIRFHEPSAPGCADLPVPDRLAVANVAQQLDNLLGYPSVREAITAGSVSLVGMYFDISQARVYLVNPDRNGLDPVPAPAH